MTLDLAHIVADINALVATTEAERDPVRFAALRATWAALDHADIEQRLSGARTTFLVARSDDDAHRQYAPSELPADYTVLASDGSMILPSRHSPARFFILNVGVAQLRYGREPDASLTTYPTLYCGDDAMKIPNDIRRTPHNETTIGLLRAVEELRAVRMQSARSPAPIVALQDGTLLLWRLESQSDAVKNWTLDGFVAELDHLRQQDIPIASYISSPGSSDVMNALRIGICDYPTQGRQINCDHCRGRIETEGHTPACDVLPMITDRQLFDDIGGLAPGARSPVYRSGSRILKEYVARGGPELEICFFYVNNGREIARVEAPRYVTDNPAHLDLVHAVVLDQCVLGRGYPVVLQEAHELAVIDMEDRRIVELAVEQALARAGVVLTWTGKDGSKRGRFV